MTSVALRSVLGSPRGLLWAALGVIVAISWRYLAAFDDVFEALCSANALPPTLQTAAILFTVWLAMALAMMLPAASPMISAYLDIAEAAQAKQITIVAPAIFVSGYLLIWVAFAAGATVIQIAAAPWLAAPHPALAGAALALAGAYQFSALKHACLSKCRAPMSYFLSRWSDRGIVIFRMGAEQGAACLGCCWALMALGLLAGLMNVIWMAVIAVIAILERTLPEPRPVTYGCGIGLLAAGILLAAFG
jgi:predicted metal-binding membrane protein